MSSPSNSKKGELIVKPGLVLNISPKYVQVLWRWHYSEKRKGVIRVPCDVYCSYELLRTYIHELFKLNRGKKVFQFNDMTDTITQEESDWLKDDMNRRIYFRSMTMYYDNGD